MNKRNILPLLFSSVLFVACSNEITPEEQRNPMFGYTDGEEPVPVMFSISEQHDFTRSATSIVQFTSGEAVKVCVSTDEGTSYTPYDFTAAATGQNVTLNPPTGDNPRPYFPVGSGTSVEAYAYYPASGSMYSTVGDNTVFTVASVQTEDGDYKDSDLMYASNRTITKGSSTGTELAMAHQMVQLKISATAQSGSDLTVYKVKVNAKNSVVFAPNTATITSTREAKADITALTAAGTGYICIPVQKINDITIKIETDAAGTADKTATFSFTSTDDFVAGSSYPINLTISAAQLGATTAISDWNGQASVTYAPSGDLTIDPVTAQTYKGSAYTAEDMSSLVVVKKGETILDYGTDYDLQLMNNINAGTAIVVALGKGETYSGSVAVATFTINKATPVVTAPTIIDGLAYTGSAQNLVTAGSTIGGEMQYSLDGLSYNTAVPSTINAGSYTVYYKVVGNDNYEDVVPQTIVVPVAQVAGDFAYATTTLKKWSSAENFTNTLTKSGDGLVSYASSDTNVADVNASTGEIDIKGMGTTTITANIEDGTNYTYATHVATYTLTVVNLPTTLLELKTAINAGENCSELIGYQVDATGEIAETVSGTLIGYVGFISTSNVDIDIPGSRILVLASRDIPQGRQAWGSYGTLRGLTTQAMNGYTYTQSLHNWGSSAHPAGYYAWEYNVAIPSGGSTPAHWFMPSRLQLGEIVRAIGGADGLQFNGTWEDSEAIHWPEAYEIFVEKVNWSRPNGNTNADWYWTSTEAQSTASTNAWYANYLRSDTWMGSTNYKNSAQFVRCCFAY